MQFWQKTNSSSGCVFNASRIRSLVASCCEWLSWNWILFYQTFPNLSFSFTWQATVYDWQWYWSWKTILVCQYLHTDVHEYFLCQIPVSEKYAVACGGKSKKLESFYREEWRMYRNNETRSTIGHFSTRLQKWEVYHFDNHFSSTSSRRQTQYGNFVQVLQGRWEVGHLVVLICSIYICIILHCWKSCR